MSDGQWCDYQSKQVTRGECHKCNVDYRELGVHPFRRCFRGHTFKPIEARIEKGVPFCPTCNAGIVETPKTQGYFCCDRVECNTNCDWYMDSRHCNLARDPKDARKWYDGEIDLVHPETGGITTQKADDYLIAMHQVGNQEAMRIKDEDLKAIGKDLTEQWMNIKFLHKGNADDICRDIQEAYNRLLKPKYNRVEVKVTFKIAPGKLLPQISITGGNSITAWLLHELVPYVTI